MNVEDYITRPGARAPLMPVLPSSTPEVPDVLTPIEDPATPPDVIDSGVGMPGVPGSEPGRRGQHLHTLLARGGRADRGQHELP